MNHGFAVSRGIRGSAAYRGGQVFARILEGKVIDPLARFFRKNPPVPAANAYP